MRGGSQADLVETSGGIFVVKWLQNAQHRRVLINEAFSSQLMHRLGIAAADWAVVKADAEFLQNFPATRVCLHRGFRSVEAGVHFGSRTPRNPETALIFDVLPQQLIGRLRNPQDLLSAFVFDSWTDNNDAGQAVFTRSCYPWFEARVIDHGHAFGFDGEEWSLKDHAASARQPLPATMYLAVNARQCFDTTIRAIQSISVDDLTAIIRRIPREWLANDGPRLECLAHALIRRAARLPQLLELRLESLRSFHQKAEIQSEVPCYAPFK